MYWECSSFHADYFHIFFYQGASATADLYDDIVLRFAHGKATSLYRDRFQVYANGYYPPPFEFRFEINTPFPFHAELHINRTQFDYEGEYLIFYDHVYLCPNFIINVNGKMILHVYAC